MVHMKNLCIFSVYTWKIRELSADSPDLQQVGWYVRVRLWLRKCMRVTDYMAVLTVKPVAANQPDLPGIEFSLTGRFSLLL